jgi:ribosome-associated protein
MTTPTPHPLPFTFDDLERAGEVSFEFARSAGPGGQNVNKVSTAVRLRFDVARSAALPEAVRLRLARLAGRRLTYEGVLLLEAQRFRTQERNRADAIERLMALIARAFEAPRPRHATRATLASRERRLTEKKHRGETKRGRGPVAGE